MIMTQLGSATTLLASQSVTQGATATANLDMRGADYVTLHINKGANTNATANAVTLSVLESDNTNATTFATVTANITAGSSAGLYVYQINCTDRKRYVRLSFTPGTAAGDAVSVGAVAVLTQKEENPATATDYAANTVIVS